MPCPLPEQLKASCSCNPSSPSSPSAGRTSSARDNCGASACGSCRLQSRLAHRDFDIRAACSFCGLHKFQLPGESDFSRAKDAHPGESCYSAVRWAMRDGIREHPNWYPGLSSTSSFADFQASPFGLLEVELAMSDVRPRCLRRRCTRPHPWQLDHNFLPTRMSLSAEATPKKCPPPCTAR